METFNWPVLPDMQVSAEPKVHVVKFGDGYEQRAPVGINNNLKVYDITIRVNRQDVCELEDFFARHGGVTAFLWTPPYDYRTTRVVCRKWSSRVGMLKAVFTATFEQVIA
ncbi:phage tail protein [Edwardsiella tarda]|nr:phage tail protein [Edwardsiella tarda]ATI62785.1 phage tail protein [Edwardsiella tarda]UCQ52855.1 phage tail protein [Edwardsiella tarda]STD45832.1 Phage-related protein [Edwardsiella tarda]BEH72540.1 phage tail protein [Edwardsiella tarda]GAC63440.1 hypothetical protein ET1_05_01270 [Edwardsiella tarda ATCC 15947 = NBRC 105688]